MKTKGKLTILFLCVLISCSNMKVESNQEGFISRVHYSSHEIEWYKMLGSTNLSKHLNEIKKIDWKKEYWEQWNSSEFNMPRLEVFDTIRNTYLSISVCPRTESSFQFEVAIGKHSLNERDGKTKTDRYVKVYGMDTDRIKKVNRIIYAFFNRNEVEFQERIDDLYFLYETDDLYLNFE